MSNKSATLDPRIRGGLEDIIFPDDVRTNGLADYFCANGDVVGYAADCLDDFSDLGDLTSNLVRCVHVNPGALYPFACCNVMKPCGSVRRQLFIPQSAVYRPHDDIPKARPFTINKFEDRFDPPCVVCYRLKDSSGPRSTVIVGQVLAYSYIPGDDDSLEIVLSGMSTTMPLSARWLFDHVEWSPARDLVDWRPFGVEGV